MRYPATFAKIIPGMERGSLTPGDLVGKLEVLRFACEKCDRRGQYPGPLYAGIGTPLHGPKMARRPLDGRGFRLDRGRRSERSRITRWTGLKKLPLKTEHNYGQDERYFRQRRERQIRSPLHTFSQFLRGTCGAGSAIGGSSRCP
jgi:hypothetical protein